MRPFASLFGVAPVLEPSRPPQKTGTEQPRITTWQTLATAAPPQPHLPAPHIFPKGQYPSEGTQGTQVGPIERVRPRVQKCLLLSITSLSSGVKF
jgi:hypothetical protein